MKAWAGVLTLASSVFLLSGCAVDTAVGDVGYDGGYNSYTVGYGNGDGYYGYGGYNGYRGYGGWASSYYAPGYRYNNTWAGGYRGGYAGHGYYGGRGGYVAHGGYAGRGGYHGGWHRR